MSEAGFLLLGLGNNEAQFLLLGLDGDAAPVVQPPVVTPPPSPPTDEEIADALSGRAGPIVARFRYEWRDHDYLLLADISDAVEQGGYLEMDNSRSVPVTGRLSLRPENLPADFDVDTSHIAISMQVLISGSFVSFPLAVTHSDVALTTHRTNGLGGTDELLLVDISELCIHLEGVTSDTYVIASGTNYVTAAETILDDLELTHSIPSTVSTLPVPMTFGPATPWRTILDQLMLGINYFPVWTDGQGVFVSRFRNRPPDEAATVSYVTTTEPRMILGEGAEVELAHSGFDNRTVVVIDHPARTPAYELRENSDGSNHISTVTTSTRLNEIDGQFVVDTTVAGEIAEYHLLDQIARSSLLRIGTLPDPRRSVRDFYQIDIESAVTGLYQLLSWRMPLEVGSPMEHLLGFVQDATLTEPI